MITIIEIDKRIISMPSGRIIDRSSGSSSLRNDQSRFTQHVLAFGVIRLLSFLSLQASRLLPVGEYGKWNAAFRFIETSRLFEGI